MSLNQQLGARHGWIPRAAGLCLLSALSCVAQQRATSTTRKPHVAVAGASALHPVAASAPALANHFQVKNYFLDFAGDHSLSAATVTEQATAQYVRYTVQLRLASGAEQSVIVAAPPGGLQIEMRDMTGDHVPNDVILRPALLRWPATVLVNDGHDHFAVVVSGVDPGSFSSREDLGSRPRDTQTFAFLRSSGFKAIQLPHSKRLLVPRLQQGHFSLTTQAFAKDLRRASSPGRAPPFVTTI